MLIVDLGDIYFNRSYRDNAVVISNESEMPLDFVVIFFLKKTLQKKIH